MYNLILMETTFTGSLFEGTKLSFYCHCNQIHSKFYVFPNIVLVKNNSFVKLFPKCYRQLSSDDVLLLTPWKNNKQ